MDQESLNQRLSRITTHWTVLRQAHTGTEQAKSAKELLLQRYRGAVYRYLLAAVRDSHVADDLTQEFGLAFVKGEFHRVAPQGGRFRDYVKAVLFHLVSHYRKGQRAGARPLAPDSPLLRNLAARSEDLDRKFRESWREELLARAWEALAQAQPTFYAVLRFRAGHPDLSSPQLAEQLTRELGKAFTPDSARQTLHRAREKYADLLLEEVAQSLDPPSAEEVERELCDLNLQTYCQPALDRLTRAP